MITGNIQNTFTQVLGFLACPNHSIQSHVDIACQYDYIGAGLLNFRWLIRPVKFIVQIA